MNNEEKNKILSLWGKVIVGIAPAGVIGVLFDDWFDEHFYNYVVVSLALIIYGIAFIVIEKKRSRREESTFRVNDVYDIKLRNDFLSTFNLENYLDRIKCRLLIVSIDNNNYYIPEYDSIPLHNMVEDSELIFLDTSDEYNQLEYIYKIEDEIKEFLDSL